MLGPVPVSVICDDIRVQVLSPSLVRLEIRGPKGFEDRETFNVVGRAWSKVPVRVRQDGSQVVVRAPRFVVRLPQHAHLLSEVTVSSVDGAVLYKGSDTPAASAFLPSPGQSSKTWVMSDYPRIAPPKWGATPPPSPQPDSGWDRGNNALDTYVFVPESYAGLRRDFLKLTGAIEKPPLYALGFIDSRYHPYTEEEALGVIDTYRRKRIPLDMFVVDTDWRPGGSDGYEIESKYFPDMPRFMREAHARNVRLMFNDHPNPISKDPLDPKELQFRWDGLTKLMGMGLDVWWYDRNWSTSLGEPLPGLRKELWGQRLYHDMTLRFRPDQRPLIMTNFQGIDNGYRRYAPQPAGHRYPIWWTGDTQSTWDFLQKGVQNGVDMGVLALSPYVGEDLGGHVGQPSPELYVRFLQYGLLSPTARIHCTRGNTRYPWEFGPEAERIVTDYVRMRYRLLPTLYSAAQRAYEDGTPLLRRLDLEWPDQPQASRNDEYLLGDDLLVAPVVTSETDNAMPVPTEGFDAEFFAGTELKGESIARRRDSNIAFDWGESAPVAGVPRDNFSARWSGEIGPVPKTGDYTLVTRSDDGVRLWVDGKQVIDAWVPQDNTTNKAVLRFDQGSRHTVRLEYYEGSGNARIRLGWIPPSDLPPGMTRRDVWIPPGQWRSVYSGETVEGPKLVRVSAPLWQCPMWARAGGLITLAPEMQFSGQHPWDTLTLEAFALAGNGVVSRVLAEDDGISNEYLRDRVSRTRLQQRRDGNSLEIRISGANGSYTGMPARRAWRLRLNIPSNAAVENVWVDGRETRGFDVTSGVVKGAPLGEGRNAGKVLTVDLPSAGIRSSRQIRVRFRD